MNAENITQLLNAIHDGQDDAWDRLVPMVYGELKRIAKYRLRGLNPGASVKTTELVHETTCSFSGDPRSAGRVVGTSSGRSRSACGTS